MTPRSGLEPPMDSPTPCLYKLPLEILYYVVEDLELGEFFDLARCSQHLSGMLKDESMCRLLLLNKAAKATETIEAAQDGRYCRALRRLVKRRRAYAQADPYAVGTLGLVQSYFYKSGTVCYLKKSQDRSWLHILNLCNSMRAETVVEVRYMLTRAGVSFPERLGFRFRILHHAHDITSCLCTPCGGGESQYLLVFRAKDEHVMCWIELESAYCLFVRNNADTLFYGSLEHDSYGSKRWILKAYDLVGGKPSEKRMQLSRLRGCDIGVDVSFEIMDDYFYGACNKVRGENRDETWNSYYYAFRFPVTKFDVSEVEILSKENSWRRDQREGPIDDRWGVLNLQQDELSGLPRLVEVRKEWLADRSGHQRTCYMKELAFENTRSSLQAPDTTTNSSQSLSAATQASSNADFRQDEGTMRKHRSKCHVHEGDDNSDPTILTRSKTYFSGYQHSSNSFIDMYDDDRFAGDSSTQHIRLRVGSRELLQPNIHRGTNSKASADRTYSKHEVRVWPEPSNATYSNGVYDASNVIRILNPADFKGPAIVTSDERILIYTLDPLPRSAYNQKILIFASFDPATQLLIDSPGEGVSFRSLQASPLSNFSTIHTWTTAQEPGAPSPPPHAREQHTGLAAKELENKLKQRTAPSPPKAPGRAITGLATGSQQPINPASWASIQEPQYCKFPGQMWLGYRATNVEADNP